jgi:hypothetical protein
MEFYSGYSQDSGSFAVIFISTRFTILLLANLFAVASVSYYKRLHNIGGNPNNCLCTGSPKYYTIGVLWTVTLILLLGISHNVLNTGVDKNFSGPTTIFSLVLLSVMVFYILKEEDSTIPIMKSHLFIILCLDNRVEQMELDDPGIYMGPTSSHPGGPMELYDPEIYMGPPRSHPGGPMELDDPGIYMGPPSSHPGGPMELGDPGIYMGPPSSHPGGPMEFLFWYVNEGR